MDARLDDIAAEIGAASRSLRAAPTGSDSAASTSCSVDETTLASLLAAVDDGVLQSKVLRLANAAAEADKHQADAEALVVAAARQHWPVDNYDQPSRAAEAGLPA